MRIPMVYCIRVDLIQHGGKVFGGEGIHAVEHRFRVATHLGQWPVVHMIICGVQQRNSNGWSWRPVIDAFGAVIAAAITALACALTPTGRDDQCDHSGLLRYAYSSNRPQAAIMWYAS